MTTKDEALKQALDALEFSKSYLNDLSDAYGTSKKAKPGSTAWHVLRAITACREALAQKDEQEPLVWMWNLRSDPIHKGYYEKHPASYGIDVSSQKYIWTPLYTAPPKRKPLTDEEIMQIGRELGVKCVLGGNPSIDFDYARAIERAHGIRGKK